MGLLRGLLAGNVAGTNAYYTAVMADTPLGYWRLGETTGSAAADSSGNSHPGTYVSCSQGAPSLVTNSGGDLAVAGNGSSSQITVGAVSALYSLSRSFAIEAWIKPASVASGVLSGIWSSGYLGFCLRRNGTSIQLLRDYSSSLGIVSASLVAGVRYQVGVEVSSTGTATVYLNGAAIGTVDVSAYSYGGSYVRLGADGSSSTLVETFLDGTLDEVSVYSHTLGASRWAAHYAAAG